MERLGNVINQAVLEGLLNFSKALEGEIQVIMECMNMFFAVSGQNISLKKSSIAFSAGVDEEGA